MISVLIADDHPIVRHGIASVLAGTRDLSVVGVAEDGAEAVEMALKTRPDVVVIDLQMGKVGGISATAEIKSKLPETEIIVLTTFDSEELIFGALEAGACAYLLKSAPPEDLVNAIRAARRGESILAPRIAAKVIGRVVAGRSPAGELSAREIEVLRLMARGYSNSEIAAALVIGASTVKTHVEHIYGKLGARNRLGAVLEGTKRGIISA
ncbi:MAG: response regulator transcription factor [Chloroflexi bacterium]|nr:response regulator transcription factor [Chloroflexota bacterium]